MFKAFWMFLLSILLSFSGSTQTYSTVHSGTFGAEVTNLTWSFNSSSGLLTISGEGEMDDASFYELPDRYEAPWYAYQKIIKTVSIKEGVTSVGSYMFWECDNITDVSLPESLLVIEEGAFSGCERLKNINIPESVTSIGTFAFWSCKSLEEITLPAGLTSIEKGTFRYCTALKEVMIPSRVEFIRSDAFSECSSLERVVIPEGVCEIWNYAFEKCVSLEGVTIPNGVTDLGKMAFSGCTSLKYAVIPDSLTHIGEAAFSGCSSLNRLYYTGSIDQFSLIEIDDRAYFLDDVKAPMIFDYEP